MSRTNDLAFPYNHRFPNKDGTESVAIQLGMTKREYFAAIAMQALLSHSRPIQRLFDSMLDGGLNAEQARDRIRQRLAHLSLTHADALITELEKSKQDEGQK